jgi:peroxiredoxin
MRTRTLVGAALVAVLVLAGGCSTKKKEPPVPGGRQALPAAAVPAGVTFPAASAASPTAPDFHVSLVDGTAVSGSGLWADRPVLLYFFDTWCRPCAAERAGLDSLASRYRDVAVVLGVVGDEQAATVRHYLIAHPVSYPVAIDASRQVWLRYAAAEPPMAALISKGGRLVRGWPGGTTTAVLQTALDQLVHRT